MKGFLVVSGTVFLALVLLLIGPLWAQGEILEEKLEPMVGSFEVASSRESLEEIVEIMKRFEKGINTKDISLTMSVIASSYSDNNFDNNPPWPLYEPFKSKEALRKGFERIFKLTDELHFEFSKPELEIKEGLATGHIWVRQSYDITHNFEGRMRIDLVKKNGQWRISRWEWGPVSDLDELRACRDTRQRGTGLLRKGDEKGLDILREVVEKYPHWANYAQLEIAEYYFLNNDFERASQEYKRVLDIWVTAHTTGRIPAQRARKLISIIEEFSSNASILKAYATAKKLEKDGKKGEAIKAYRDMVNSYPEASFAPDLMSWVCLLSRDAEDKEELIKRYPYSKEAQRLLRDKKLRPEALSSLIESYPDAPWANDAKEIIESSKNKVMREAEIPAVKNAVREHLSSLEAIDYVATLESINKDFLAIRPYGDLSYWDVKRRAENLDASNVRSLFLISDEKYVVHPDGNHAAAFLAGKKIWDIFRNGSCFAPDTHEYGTASFTLEKEKDAWKVSSYIWSDLSPSEEVAKKADVQEIELLKKWEEDVQKLENRQRIARTLEGIGERYEALDMKEEFERITELLKQEYSDTYVVKGMLEKKVGEHFFIRYNIPEEYAEAILNLCEVAYQGYKEVYGIDLLKDYPDPKIQITARFGGRLSLWVAPDSNPDINLITPNVERLGPPREVGGKGAHYVYGFVHEMGHIAIGFDEEKGAWTQGIAHYIGSQLLPYVKEKLGDKAWPIPYDYVNIEGPPRLMRGIEKAEPGTHDAACKVLYEIEKKYGPKVIGQAVYKTKEMGHSSRMPGGVKQYPIENFKSALIEITGDKEIEKLFTDNGF